MRAPGARTLARGVLDRPALPAALGAAAISSSAILVELARTPATTTAFYRCTLALPLLLVLSRWERRTRGPRPTASRLLAGVAGLFLAVDLVLWNHAIDDVGAGVATVLGNLQVLFVTFLAWAVHGERPGRRVLAALPVVMGGVVLAAGLLGTRPAGTHPLAGVVYGIGTSLAYAGFLLILRQASGGRPHVAGPVADATAGSAVGSLLLGAALGIQFAPGWAGLGWLAVLALTSQTLGWLLITSSLPRLPAALSSILLLLQPAAALLLAYLVLGEQPTGLQLAGAALVCGGVLAASLRGAAAAAADSAEEESVAAVQR